MLSIVLHEWVAIFLNLQGHIKAEDRDSGGELNSGCSSPFPHTPLQPHDASKNDEIKNLSSEFELENSWVYI